MKILAISGSLRDGSANTALMRALAARAPKGVEVAIYAGLAALPHFSPELDGDNPPAPVHDLRARMGEAGGAVICTPEYAFGMPGSLKNALDWLVTSGELWRKPVAAISASPSALGGEKAHAALRLTLTALEAEIVEAASLTVPFVRAKVTAGGDVSNPATAQALQAAIEALAQAVLHKAENA